MKKSEKNKTLETDGKPTLYWNRERDCSPLKVSLV